MPAKLGVSGTLKNDKQHKVGFALKTGNLVQIHILP